jgi:hypothetical protein
MISTKGSYFAIRTASRDWAKVWKTMAYLPPDESKVSPLALLRPPYVYNAELSLGDHRTLRYISLTRRAGRLRQNAPGLQAE